MFEVILKIDKRLDVDPRKYKVVYVKSIDGEPYFLLWKDGKFEWYSADLCELAE
jgi:hypothetical protein